MSSTAELVRHGSLATSEPSEARAMLDEIFEIGAHFSAPPETRWDLLLQTWDAPSFAVAGLRLPGVLDVSTHAEKDVVIASVLRGACVIERGPDTRRHEIGDAFIANVPDVEWHAVCTHIQAHAVTLPVALLTDVAGGGDEDAPSDWQFTAFQPTAAGGLAWRQATRYVDGVLADAGRLTPLTVSAAGRLLAATALSVFPNDAAAETTVEERRDAHPRTLHRAISFIEANPDLDISVQDVARASFVTPRTLQLAFRRHLQTTPMGYLKRVRLERVRADLLDADPLRGGTVTKVAARWGFADASRLSTTYSAAFGELPRETLHRS